MEPLRERVSDIVCEVSDDSGNYQTRLPQKKLNAFIDAIMQAVEEDRAAQLAAVVLSRDAMREYWQKAEARESVLMKALQDTADTRDAMKAREAALREAVGGALLCSTCHYCDKDFRRLRAALGVKE